MMRKILILTGGLAVVIATLSCNSPRRKTGAVYMPDMAYSRAYETYGPLDTNTFTMQRNGWGANEQSKIYYTSLPVTGTVARGEMPEYPYKNDTIGYRLSAGVKNPLDSASVDLKEAERLYLVNCAICHGPKLDGNGPLWKDGSGPFQAAPRNFMDPLMKAMPEGTMFHSTTYGRNMMGSYASQLSVKERWMVIAFIKNKQGVGGAASTPAAAASTSDTTAAATGK